MGSFGRQQACRRASDQALPSTTLQALVGLQQAPQSTVSQATKLSQQSASRQTGVRAQTQTFV
eukprot:3241904-Alexandrium_andersonii.AAC.1